ncbi:MULTISPECIES: hypothetical protein [unclassified Pseudomonas]|uniref:hypothetical protein n=1 Tax=unclassified Pseudomonas TaxID=196821 RepID=UPI0008713DBE|nr:MULTISPECIES: hypothetical protein [unclassified Pseudomonas]SCW26997.1 hypothetical protein SAMN03159481_00021 [Pseudomonas sp. NFACC56-3]SFK08714.1 hypothetical protein SAMN03159473_00021 [Pseudomonas sp. NFACC52]
MQHTLHVAVANPRRKFNQSDTGVEIPKLNTHRTTSTHIGQPQTIYFVKEVTKDVHQGGIELGTGLIGDVTPRTLDIPSLFVGSGHSYGVIHVAYRPGV